MTFPDPEVREGLLRFVREGGGSNQPDPMLYMSAIIQLVAPTRLRAHLSRAATNFI